ncbi:hypothetical protein CRE_14800 [Caenorhabditis remanei]|uniref:Uncharacterized protein n=1 Tax=Caenorhabditis remanei TaxID=31234 RepID=E3MRT2_CAERE|nr:hypothetical protein CRE_14800 [Caenorhabditis remanei]
MKFFSSKIPTSLLSCTSIKHITPEDIRHYKETMQNMKGQKMNASAMHLITNETIYQVTVEVATRAIHTLKKVIGRGVCEYKMGSKTDRLIASYNQVHEEYKEMLVKMEIKMKPSKAEYVIECWLKKDAAEKATQEHKDRRRMRKEFRKAAVEKALVNYSDGDSRSETESDDSKSMPELETTEYIPGCRILKEIIV